MSKAEADSLRAEARKILRDFKDKHGYRASRGVPEFDRADRLIRYAWLIERVPTHEPVRHWDAVYPGEPYPEERGSGKGTNGVRPPAMRPEQV